MQRQPSQDTGPELAVRRALHAMGLRYRVHRQPLPGLRRTADIVFRGARVAVFVDGCFWHGCHECYGRRTIKTNEWYWPAKIARTQARDADTDRRLREAGWLSLRVWEHEEPLTAAARVADAVRKARRGPNMNISITP